MLFKEKIYQKLIFGDKIEFNSKVKFTKKLYNTCAGALTNSNKNMIFSRFPFFLQKNYSCN